MDFDDMVAASEHTSRAVLEGHKEGYTGNWRKKFLPSIGQVLQE